MDIRADLHGGLEGPYVSASNCRYAERTALDGPGWQDRACAIGRANYWTFPPGTLSSFPFTIL